MTPTELGIANEKLTALTLRMYALLAELTPEQVLILTYQPEN